MSTISESTFETVDRKYKKTQQDWELLVQYRLALAESAEPGIAKADWLKDSALIVLNHYEPKTPEVYAKALELFGEVEKFSYALPNWFNTYDSHLAARIAPEAFGFVDVDWGTKSSVLELAEKLYRHKGSLETIAGLHVLVQQTITVPFNKGIYPSLDSNTVATAVVEKLFALTQGSIAYNSFADTLYFVKGHFYLHCTESKNEEYYAIGVENLKKAIACNSMRNNASAEAYCVLIDACKNPSEFGFTTVPPMEQAEIDSLLAEEAEFLNRDLSRRLCLFQLAHILQVYIHDVTRTIFTPAIVAKVFDLGERILREGSHLTFKHTAAGYLAQMCVLMWPKRAENVRLAFKYQRLVLTLNPGEDGSYDTDLSFVNMPRDDIFHQNRNNLKNMTHRITRDLINLCFTPELIGFADPSAFKGDVIEMKAFIAQLEADPSSGNCATAHAVDCYEQVAAFMAEHEAKSKPVSETKGRDLCILAVLSAVSDAIVNAPKPPAAVDTTANKNAAAAPPVRQEAPEVQEAKQLYITTHEKLNRLMDDDVMCDFYAGFTRKANEVHSASQGINSGAFSLDTGNLLADGFALLLSMVPFVGSYARTIFSTAFATVVASQMKASASRVTRVFPDSTMLTSLLLDVLLDLQLNHRERLRMLSENPYASEVTDWRERIAKEFPKFAAACSKVMGDYAEEETLSKIAAEIVTGVINDMAKTPKALNQGEGSRSERYHRAIYRLTLAALDDVEAKFAEAARKDAEKKANKEHNNKPTAAASIQEHVNKSITANDDVYSEKDPFKGTTKEDGGQNNKAVVISHPNAVPAANNSCECTIQ